MQIYVHRDNEDFGPYSREAVLEYVKQGVFEAFDLACYAGMPEWKTIGELLNISAETPGRRSRKKRSVPIGPAGEMHTPASLRQLPPQSERRRGLMILVNILLVLLVATFAYIRLGGGGEKVRHSLEVLSVAIARLAHAIPENESAPAAPSSAPLAKSSAAAALPSPAPVSSPAKAVALAPAPVPKAATTTPPLEASPTAAASPALMPASPAPPAGPMAAASPAPVVGLTPAPGAASTPASAAAPPLPVTAATPGPAATPAPTPGAFATPVGAASATPAVVSTPAPALATTPAPAPATSPSPTPASTPIPAVSSLPAPQKPFDPADIAGNPAAWPKTVQLKQAVMFPAVYNSQVMGSVSVPAGTVVNLVSIQADQLTVEYQGGRQTVSWKLTNLGDPAANAGTAAPAGQPPAH